MTNNDDIKQFLKKFYNDDTKKILKGSLIMLPKQFKSSAMMILKSLKRFLNDGTKKVPK